MLPVLIIVSIPASLVVGFFTGHWIMKRKGRKEIDRLKTEITSIRERLREEKEILRSEFLKKGDEERVKIRKELERELYSEREEIRAWEKKLRVREDNLEKRAEVLNKKEANLERLERALEKKELKIQEIDRNQKNVEQEIQRRLEKIAGMTIAEAKQQLIESIEAEARMEAEKKMKEIENEIKEFADKRAKEIIAVSVQRFAGDIVSDLTISVVNIPNDEMKGRIIGREGRNIKALEQATGVDFIIDDTPNAVILSSFDPVRREIAREALNLLITDGRIHPGRIEDIVKKAEKEVEDKIRDAGEQIALEVGVHGLHPELIKLLGRLKFRTSYGQNQYQHSLEVAFLAGLMAGELGLSIKKAKRAGLLHDIGKAIGHQMEGSHALIGADVAKKYGESPLIINAIASHHEEVEPESPIAVLVQAADALSGARPGARREIYEAYIKRIHDLEKICSSFKEVQKAYAIQAGREVRVIVNSGSLTDEGVSLLAKDIAKKVEDDITYPGNIKITVIREVRAIEYAK